MNEKNIVPMDAPQTETAAESSAPKPDYTHKFSAPFVWMGKTYETIDFYFSKLKGKDALAVYGELQAKGVLVVSARTSQRYQLGLASKACGLGEDAFEEMPLQDFEIIMAKARNFIPAAALL